MKRKRDIEKSRREILDVAFAEIFARGFQGVSVDDIVQKTSFTKGAFYHQFPTKLDLGYTLVKEVITPMIVERWVAPLDEWDNPLEGILKQMKVLIGNAPDLSLGCPLNNLVQEMAPIDEEFKKCLHGALQVWISGIEDHLKRARKNGFLKKEVDTKALAHFIVMTHEGFFGLLKGTGDPQTFDYLFRSLKRYFATLSPD